MRMAAINLFNQIHTRAHHFLENNTLWTRIHNAWERALESIRAFFQKETISFPPTCIENPAPAEKVSPSSVPHEEEMRKILSLVAQACSKAKNSYSPSLSLTRVLAPHSSALKELRAKIENLPPSDTFCFLLKETSQELIILYETKHLFPDRLNPWKKLIKIFEEKMAREDNPKAAQPFAAFLTKVAGELGLSSTDVCHCFETFRKAPGYWEKMIVALLKRDIESSSVRFGELPSQIADVLSSQLLSYQQAYASRWFFERNSTPPMDLSLLEKTHPFSVLAHLRANYHNLFPTNNPSCLESIFQQLQVKFQIPILGSFDEIETDVTSFSQQLNVNSTKVKNFVLASATYPDNWLYLTRYLLIPQDL